MEGEYFYDIKKSYTSKLKEGVFSVFDTLLDNNSISIIGFLIYHIIEFFQLMYFNFYEMFATYWRIPGIYNTIKTFLQYFWIVLIIPDDFNYYIITFYFFIFTNFLTAFSFIYILICLKKNYNIWGGAKMFLKFICNIYNTVLLIPMSSTFIRIFNCHLTNDDYLINNHFNEIGCLQGTNIVHYIFALIGIIFVFSFGLIINIIYVDTYKSKNVKARLPNSFENLFFFTKFILVVVFEISNYLGNSSVWTCNIFNLVLGSVNFIFLMKEKPYFDTNVQKFLILSLTLVVFTSSIITLSLILQDNFTGAIELFLIGSIFIIMFITVYFIKKHDIIIINNENIREENLIMKKIFYILELIDNQDLQENELFVKGYIMIQNYEENKFNTNLNNLRLKLEEYNMNNKNKKKKNEEEYAAFIKYIDEYFKNAIHKFPYSNIIKLYYTLFLIKYLKNHVIATNILKKIELNKPTLSEEFEIYRFNRLVEEKLLFSNKMSQNLDINLEISYKRIKNVFTNLIETTSLYLLEFWDIISREERNMVKIEKLIFKINENLENIFSFWKDIRKLKNNDINLQNLYKKFLKYVLNDEHTGQEIMNFYQNQENNSLKDPILGEFYQYVQDGSAYIYASGSCESIGKILSANSSACRLFGYTIDAFLKLNINDLIPENLREEHEKKLIDISEREKSRAAKDFRRIYTVGVNRSGYIFPINMTLSIVNCTGNIVNILAFIRPPHSDLFKNYPCFLLTDVDLKIKYVSSQAIVIFGINNTNYFIKKKLTNMTEYLDASDLIQELKKLKEDTNNINEYKYSSGINNKKKIVIDNLDFVRRFIQECGENNKTIKIEEKDERGFKKNKKNENFKTFNDHFDEMLFKEFYISIVEVKIMEKSLGYIIQLEPTKEDDYIHENRTIVYETNIYHFNTQSWKFVDPNKLDTISIHQINENESVSNINNDNLLKNSGNIVDNFIREHKVENYSKFITCKCLDLPTKFMFKLVDEKYMKVTETLRLIEEIVRDRQDVREIEIENDSEETNMVEKSKEDFFNYKGIDGWQTLINKIKKNKIPREIKILKFMIIFVGLIKFVLMILYFLYVNSKYYELFSLNKIQNYTQFHTHLMLDSITLSEKIMNYHLNFTSNKTEFDYNIKLIYEKISSILNLTNDIRQFQITNEPVNEIFHKNYSFYLIDAKGDKEDIQMNLIEIFMQLLNKLISIIDYFDTQTLEENYEDYYIFFLNTMNIYIKTIISAIESSKDNFFFQINECTKSFQNILLISLSFLVFAIINNLYIVKIKNIKHNSIELFFTIPQKFCWKYYTNCEKFIRYLKNEENDESSVNYEEISNLPQELEENDSDKSIYNIILEKMIINNRNYNKKINRTNYMMILNVIMLNFIYFLFVISFYGFNLMIFNLYSNKLYISEDFNYKFFSNEILLQSYSINQRQIYNKTNIDIMFTNNFQLQNILFKNITQQEDALRLDFVEQVPLLPQSLNIQLNSLKDGLCYPNSTYENICKLIPDGYRSIDKVKMHVYLKYTSFFLNYTANINNSSSNFSGPNILKNNEFKNINIIRDEYINPLLESLQIQLINYIDSSINFLSTILLLLLVLYSICLIIIFVFYLVLYQNKIVVEIIYTKSTLLLIQPNDIKEIKPIMNYLKKEIYKINNH